MIEFMEVCRCLSCGHFDHIDRFEVAGADEGKVFCPRCGEQVEAVGFDQSDTLCLLNALVPALEECVGVMKRAIHPNAAPKKAVEALALAKGEPREQED